MDTYTDIERASYKLAEAQRELDEAKARQEKLDSFSTESAVFVLQAVKYTCDQWITYAEDGIAIGIFTTRQEAQRYADTFEHPAGLAYRIKEFPLYG